MPFDYAQFQISTSKLKQLMVNSPRLHVVGSNIEWRPSCQTCQDRITGHDILLHWGLITGLGRLNAKAQNYQRDVST